MDITAISALVAAAVALAGSVVSWSRSKAETHHIEVDAQGEIIEDLRAHLKWTKAELQPNGGLSLRDAVDRIENRLACIDGRVAQLESKIESLDHGQP